MSYIEERFKNIERAKKYPELAQAIAKATDMPDPVPEPEQNLRPKYIAVAVNWVCNQIGHEWRQKEAFKAQQEMQHGVLSAT